MEGGREGGREEKEGRKRRREESEVGKITLMGEV